MGSPEHVPHSRPRRRRPARQGRADPVETERLAQRFRPLQEKWKRLLGLDDWTDTSTVATKGDGKTWAECNAQWEYKRFAITYYPNAAQLDDDLFEWVVVHELVHVLLSPLISLVDELGTVLDEDEDATSLVRWFATFQNERATSELTNTLLKLVKSVAQGDAQTL
jgi:HAMP domain-containing protein